MQGADLSSARLQGADLSFAQLPGAKLLDAQLQGADLSSARLPGADLIGADLQGANLIGAQLPGANLIGAQLPGAYLGLAQLQGANLIGAQLQGADLREAQLQGADLIGAQLQGAGLFEAQLQGADLRGAHLWLVQSDETTVLGFADLRGIDWAPMAAEEVDAVLKTFDEATRNIADNYWSDNGSFVSREHFLQAILKFVTQNRREAVGERFKDALKSDASAPQVPAFRLDGPALVDDPDDPHWANVVNRGHLTTNEAAFDAKLAPFLADLARSDQHVASGIVRRTTGRFEFVLQVTVLQRTLYPDLARRLLAIEGLKERLSDYDRKQLEEIAGAATPPPSH